MDKGELLYAHNMLQVNYNKSTLKLKKGDEETNWNAVQFHFHAPTEHTIDSTFYDVEFHLVHQGVEHKNNFLVVGILFKGNDEIGDNKFIESLKLEDLPKRHSDLHVRISEFMESIINTKKFNYPGSLTIPPCSENVEWLVVKDPVEISLFQVKLFTRLWADNHNFAEGKGNNREVQPVAGREIALIN